MYFAYVTFPITSGAFESEFYIYIIEFLCLRNRYKKDPNRKLFLSFKKITKMQFV